MPEFALRFYLTPAVISYLAEAILAGLISMYLFLRLRRGDTTEPTPWLAAFFTATTLLLISFIGDVSLPPSQRLYVVFVQNSLVAFCLLFLLIFAYRFPRPDPRKRWEFFLVLSLALLYLGAEAWFAFVRYGRLANREVMYRTLNADFALAVGFGWVPLVFLRQAIFADPRPVPWWRKLWQPQGSEAQAARSLAGVYLVTLTLAMVNILRTRGFIPTALYQLSLATGLMLALFAVAIVYLNALPAQTSFMVKLSGVTLTFLLSIMSIIGRAIAPVYVGEYQPVIPDHQMLRFAPNAVGGYTVTSLPPRFESDLGQRLEFNIPNGFESVRVDFTFPFFGQTYTEIYVTNGATLSIGEPFAAPNVQYRYGTSPAIYLLNTLLDATAGGDIYVRQDDDQLTITWLQLPLFFQRDKRVSCQAVLYANGVIELNFDALPRSQVFSLEDDPYNSYWLTGVVPGNYPQLPELVSYTDFPIEGGPNGLVQDHYLEFRAYIHKFLSPLASMVVVSVLSTLAGIPLVLYLSIVRPLNTLVAGVQRVNEGDLDFAIPSTSSDEIGFLTRSFNGMIAQLRELINGLETQVAERTAELKRLAITDDLTGLANRRQLRELGRQAFEHARRYQHPLAVLMIDIDHFKQINDKHGHCVGDEVLKLLGACLQENIRAADIIGRYGGEEFVILLPETDQTTAHQMAERMIDRVRMLTVPSGDSETHFTVSIGIASIRHDTDHEIEMLIDRADKSMYTAKYAGRDRVAGAEKP